MNNFTSDVINDWNLDEIQVIYWKKNLYIFLYNINIVMNDWKLD